MLAGSGYRFLSLALAFVLGVAVGALYRPVHLFLNQQLENTTAFIEGHPLETQTTAWQKVQHDLGLAPWRASRDALPVTDFDYRILTLSPDLKNVLPESTLELFLDTEASGLAGYAGMLIKTQADTGRGYSPQLLVVGFDGHLHKLIPLSPQNDCDCSGPMPLNYFHIAGDPADLRTSGNRLVNLNSCGRIDWTLESRYGFHHYLNNDGDHRRESFWILDATDLVRIETASGRVLDRIALGEIINANPDLPVFEARLKGTRPERWVYGAAKFEPIGRTHSEVTNADPDPFHGNDIDEFPGDDAGLFEKGDLLLSLRSLNLLLVVRPASRKIVWYAYGLTSRQHDPDFLSSGSIMVYDNNFHNPRSRILLLEASADAGKGRQFATRRVELVSDVAGEPFQQLIEGYQFYVDENRSLIFSAESQNFGIDTVSGRVFLAFRHRWRDQAFLAVDIERLLTAQEFDDIRNAGCS